MPAATVVTWSDRAGLAALAPDDLVILVADGDDARVVRPDDLTGLYLVTVAAADGRALAGTPDALTALVADAPAAAAMADWVRDAWERGADLDLDTEGAVLAGPDCVVVSGTTLRANGEVPVVAHGPATAVAAWSARLAEHDAAIATLLTVERHRAVALEVVANEILVSAWYTPEFCAGLCALAESFDAWAADPDDPVPGRELGLRDAPALFAAVEDDVATRLVPALREHWPELAWCGLADAFVIRYDAVEGTPPLALHHDVAQISASVRLNVDFEGGALAFPRQGWDSDELGVGDVVVWPSLVTHPHHGGTVRRGRKYGLTIWFALPV